MVEVHNHPESALSDGPQSIYPAQFATMMQELEQIAPVVGRSLSRAVTVAAAAAK
jgi:3-deoxy-7-phosphoheptulonate synthase